VNRRAIAAALAAVPLALGVGAGTAEAQPPVAPPLGAIAAPISSAPTFPGLVTGWSFDNATTLVAVSCARTTGRAAWSMPLVRQPLLSGGVAGYAKDIPVIDTGRLGSLAEWAAYGADPTTPLIRSGCLDASGQRGLHWGDPVISERAVVTPPPAGAPLAILPGEPVTTPVYAPGPTTTPAPATTTTTTTPSATSAAAAPTAQAPAYTGTPDNSASSQRTTDAGGGTPWGAIIFGLLTVLFAAGSRATSWRVRKDVDVDKLPLRGHLYGGFAALAGLIAASSAPSSVGGFFGSAVLAVLVALVLSAQREASSGYKVSVAALVRTARTEWPAAGVGAAAGFIIGYITGSGLLTPAVLYGLLAGAGVGIGAAHLRQTKARVAGWRIDAAVVADILGVQEKTITETGEVVFSTTSEGGFVVTTLSQAARAHLDGIEDRCAAVAGHLTITMATRMRVEAGPVDAETAAYREAMAGSGGLVGGAHTGADPWAGTAPAPSTAGTAGTAGTDVNMHKPSTTGTGDGTIDLSAGWD